MNIEEYFEKQVQSAVKVSRITRILMAVGVAGVVTFGTLTGTKPSCSSWSSFCTPNPGFFVPTMLFAFMTLASLFVFATSALSLGCKQALCKWTAEVGPYRQRMIESIQRRCTFPDRSTILVFGAKGHIQKLIQDPENPVILPLSEKQIGTANPRYAMQAARYHQEYPVTPIQYPESEGLGLATRGYQQANMVL